MKEKSFKIIIRQGIAGLFHICAQELKNVFKDQGVLIFLSWYLYYIRCSMPSFIPTK